MGMSMSLSVPWLVDHPKRNSYDSDGSVTHDCTQRHSVCCACCITAQQACVHPHSSSMFRAFVFLPYSESYAAAQMAALSCDALCRHLHSVPHPSVWVSALLLMQCCTQALQFKSAWPQLCPAGCCLSVQGVFEYGGQTYDLVPHPEGASAASCAKLVRLVLKQNEPCGAEQVHSSHNPIIPCFTNYNLGEHPAYILLFFNNKQRRDHSSRICAFRHVFSHVFSHSVICLSPFPRFSPSPLSPSCSSGLSMLQSAGSV